MPFALWGGGVEDPSFHPLQPNPVSPREPLAAEYSTRLAGSCGGACGDEKIIFWRFYWAILGHNQMNSLESLSETGIQDGLNGDDGKELQDAIAPLVMQSRVGTKPGCFGEERESSFTSGLEEKVCSLLLHLLKENQSGM